MGTNLTRTYNYIARHKGSDVLSTAPVNTNIFYIIGVIVVIVIVLKVLHVF